MSKLQVGLQIVILALCMQGGTCSFRIDNSPLFPDLIHFRSADFGYIPYGKIVSGKISVANDSTQQGCTNLVNTNAYGNFLIVRIGGCSIISKAALAQSNRATMLIVIADHDLIDEVHILNTGNTDKIIIPVLLFSKTDGDKIINDALGREIPLEARCFFPRDIATVGPTTVDYWFDPLDSSNYIFFFQLSSLHKLLADKMRLRIHIALSFSQESSNLKEIEDSCVSNGKYCAHDPDGNGHLKGKDVVLAGLAMLCLAKEDSSVRLTKTLIEFDRKCLSVIMTSGQPPFRCLSEVAFSNGYKDVLFEQTCFKMHFKNGDLQSDNDLLAAEKTLFEQETVQIWPELYINQRAIRGNIQSLQELESAICAGFRDPIPDACYEYFEEIESIHAGYIICIIILSAALMFSLLFAIFKYYYHQKFKSQIDGEVNSVISKYITFKDETEKS